MRKQPQTNNGQNIFHRWNKLSLFVQVNSLSVFYKQRDNLFFPVPCFVLPTTLLRLPYSALNAFIYVVFVYWISGLTYTPGRYIQPLKSCRLLQTFTSPPILPGDTFKDLQLVLNLYNWPTDWQTNPRHQEGVATVSAQTILQHGKLMTSYLVSSKIR